MGNARFDLIVVGAGLSGLMTASVAADAGLSVCVVHSGLGLFVFGAGCVERVPLTDAEADDEPAALTAFREFTRSAGCPFLTGDDPEAGFYLPTILGSFQHLHLAPYSLHAGIAATGCRVAVVGIRGLTSFDARFVADRLGGQSFGLGAPGIYVAREIDLGLPFGTVPTPLLLANRFDRDAGFRDLLGAALRLAADKVDRLLIPGILGQISTHADIVSFEAGLGCRVGELPTFPPSIPGLRLYQALAANLRDRGVEFLGGFPVTELLLRGGVCEGVVVETPARPKRVSADAVVLASGQFSSSLLGFNRNGVDAEARPLRSAGGPVAVNLYAVGALLAALDGGCGGNARAVVSGYRTAMRVVAATGGKERRHAMR